MHIANVLKTFKDIQNIVFKDQYGLILILLFNLKGNILLQNFIVCLVDEAESSLAQLL